MEPLPSDQQRATFGQIDGVRRRLRQLTGPAREHVETLYRAGHQGMSLKIESRRRWFIARGVLAIAEKFGDETEPWMFTVVTYYTGDHTTPAATQIARLGLVDAGNFYQSCVDFMVGDLYPVFQADGNVVWQRG